VLDGLGIERTHIIGNSFGGFLAINFALQYPALVHRLVLLAPAGILSFRPVIHSSPTLNRS
jgi:pimeloyl-ACP methyl ester carboxylesterase